MIRELREIADLSPNAEVIYCNNDGYEYAIDMASYDGDKDYAQLHCTGLDLTALKFKRNKELKAVRRR